MRAVGIRVLKNKLSEYVRLAESGETVLVTDRDRVVAELGPQTPGGPWWRMPFWQTRSAVGSWTAPAAPGSGPPPSRPVMSLSALLDDLASDREDR